MGAASKKVALMILTTVYEVSTTYTKTLGVTKQQSRAQGRRILRSYLMVICKSVVALGKYVIKSGARSHIVFFISSHYLANTL